MWRPALFLVGSSDVQVSSLYAHLSTPNYNYTQSSDISLLYILTFLNDYLTIYVFSILIFHIICHSVFKLTTFSTLSTIS